MEAWLIYLTVGLICLFIIWIYLRKIKKQSLEVTQKIEKAKEEGIHEPVSLYPYIDPNSCIKSGACVIACPEEEILGLRNGRATLINASRCIGHGACFHACPVEAITLRIGTESRGVELPHVSQNFETNVSGIFIAGELGGMGLIKNSVEQGKLAVDNIVKSLKKNHSCDYDLVIVGAGPAGISASLQAKKLGIKAITLEQDSLGGTVFNFPRAKVVMTAPMDLPGHGKIKLFETSKSQLLDLWRDVISKNEVEIMELKKVENILKTEVGFKIICKDGSEYSASRVLLSIGRRGTPRKLGVKGENLEKVTYKLIDPELYDGKNILVVGGGDSAIESALLLSNHNNVTLSYRGEKFGRLKLKNLDNLNYAINEGKIKVIYNSNIIEIKSHVVELDIINKEKIILNNDFVFIFAGGELPNDFLQKTGILITKRFNFTLLSHKKN